MNMITENINIDNITGIVVTSGNIVNELMVLIVSTDDFGEIDCRK